MLNKPQNREYRHSSEEYYWDSHWEASHSYPRTQTFTWFTNRTSPRQIIMTVILGKWQQNLCPTDWNRCNWLCFFLPCPSLHDCVYKFEYEQEKSKRPKSYRVFLIIKKLNTFFWVQYIRNSVSLRETNAGRTKEKRRKKEFRCSTVYV